MKDFPDLKELIGAIDARLEGAGDAIAIAAQLKSAAPDPVIKFVLVGIGGRSLALPIDSLAEVGAMVQVTNLPNLPFWILGIMNIRSEIISLVDFSGFLGDPQVGAKKGKKLAVLRRGKLKVGLALHSIDGTVTKSVREVMSAPRDDNPLGAELLRTVIEVDGRVYSILDAGKFLTHPHLLNLGVDSESRTRGQVMQPGRRGVRS